MKTTKILLCPPSTYQSGAGRPFVSLPVGLPYIMADPEKDSHDVDILNAQVHLDAPVSRDSRRDLLDMVDFALGLQRNYDVNPGLFVATPLPGTRLKGIFLERKLMKRALTPDALSKMTRGATGKDGGTLTADDVREIRETFLRKNFIGGRGQSATR